MGDPAVRYALEEAVAVLRLDDGRANAISHAVIRELHDALDRAEKEAGAVLLLGRPERFCAGFDLDTMRQGIAQAGELVQAGAELLMRIYAAPLPVVVGCTGHSLAMGALLLLAADWRVGARGSFKIGLNEVAIQMTLPVFAVELARDRLSPRHFQRAALLAEIYDPDSAREAGYLDRVVEVEQLALASHADAVRLAALPRRAFAETKQRARAAALARMRGASAG